MNTTTKTEQTALTVPPDTAVGALALATLSPETYAAEVYAPFKSQLAAAIDGVRAIDYDITTTAGLAAAVKARAVFRDLRIAADKERKARKEPITKIGKLLESGYDAVEERAAPLEQLFDFEIEQETKRKAEVKAAKERAEAARLDAIFAKIDEIRYEPGLALGMSVEALKAVIERVSAREITTEEFSTFAAQAQVALDTAIEELQKMLVGAEVAEQVKREAEEARLAELARLEAARVENERVAAENARQAAEVAAERQRLAEAAAAQQAAAQAAQKLADDAAQVERDRIAAAAAEAQAKLDAQTAALAEQSRKLAEQQAAADARDALAELIRQREIAHPEALMMNAEFDVARDAERALVAAELAAQVPAPDAVDISLGALTEVLSEEDSLTDAEIIDTVMDVFNLHRADAIDRLQAIDFDAARAAA